MPIDEPKYFTKINLEKGVFKILKKSKTIQDSSNVLHVMCDY
jgi:hypothetical protein